ncbi:diphthine methyltransferase homolog [Oryza brachyantha]|uniref:methylated diphthine methylhydrolase n=1 Tax=Oryza brachyantha TaxID=4533 RepID=J3LZF5_ORYBR|nr:diphthine methyltransferase homolog [Oryza brachyantha]XP_015692150.1 diphthine methyltransferase homolog [Oryza brachyantha]
MDLGSCYLGGNADAVEFCPHRPFRHVLAAATYTLQEQEQEHGEEERQDRAGTVSLFSVDADEEDASRRLRLLHTVETAGVFDMKWSPLAPLLARADAHGCLALWRLEQEEDGSDEGAILRDVCSGDISSSMCLFVDWNQTADSLSVGLSDGSLSVVSMREDRLEVSEQWTAHQYEVWTCYFDRAKPHLLYSGSDDCSFSCWDLRQSPSNSVFQNKKSHNMGVCCIAQNPLERNMLLTGSYDEFLRVWDMRSMVKPVSVKSLNLGGGVWRIKYHPVIADVVLAACMHNGFAIVKVGTGDAAVMETYSKHESLAYGADWQTREGAEQSKNCSVVATCSFYDRLLRVWQPENLENL